MQQGCRQKEGEGVESSPYLHFLDNFEREKQHSEEGKSNVQKWNINRVANLWVWAKSVMEKSLGTLVQVIGWLGN